MISVKKKVLQKLSMIKKPQPPRRDKRKPLREMELSLSTMYPRNQLFDLLNKKLSHQAKEYSNIVTLEDLKLKINSVECERLVLSAREIKQKGIESVFSAREKKLSFLKEGVWTSTYHFISPTLAKRIS